MQLVAFSSINWHGNYACNAAEPQWSVNFCGKVRKMSHLGQLGHISNQGKKVAFRANNCRISCEIGMN